MKKLRFLLLALIGLSVTFTSCKKDEPVLEWELEAQAENYDISNTLVDSVYAVVYERVDANNYIKHIVGKAKYENGGFKIKLSAVPPAALMELEDESDDGVIISDLTAKIGAIELFAAIKDGEEIGYFAQTKHSLEDVLRRGENLNSYHINDVVRYIYATKDFTEKGTSFDTTDRGGTTFTWKATVDLDFKKGWNKMLYNTLVDTRTERELEVRTITDTSDYHWLYIPYTYKFE